MPVVINYAALIVKQSDLKYDAITDVKVVRARIQQSPKTQIKMLLTVLVEQPGWIKKNKIDKTAIVIDN